MALFYHILGIMVSSTIVGTFYVFDPNYEIPFIPYILSDFILAGPIEESIFFGLPYYVTGSHYVTFGTGTIWAIFHIFVFDEESEDLDLIDLNYANFAFVIPTLFFSYRTWISGKGWISILVHSAWNGMAYGFDCTFDEVSCTVFGYSPDDVLFSISSISISIILLILTFWAYRRRQKKRLELR